MSCPTVTEIQRTEYIGNSLQTINNNFSILKDAICDNDAQINLLQQNTQSLDTKLTDLETNTAPSAAKAWIRFSGNRDSSNNLSSNSPTRLIYNSFNISSVYKKNTGDYRIYFNSTLTTGNYLILCTSSETQVSGEYTWCQPYTTTNEYAEIKVLSNSGNVVDPEFICVSII